MQHDAAVVHTPPTPVQVSVGAPVAPGTAGCLVGLADARVAGEPHSFFPRPDNGHTPEQHNAAELELHCPPGAMQVGALEGNPVGGVVGAPVVGLCVGLDEIVGLPVVGVAEGTLVVGMPVGLAVGMPVGLADPMGYILVHNPLATWFHILALTC